jgi:hypothetical protein
MLLATITDLCTPLNKSSGLLGWQRQRSMSTPWPQVEVRSAMLKMDFLLSGHTAVEPILVQRVTVAVDHYV